MLNDKKTIEENNIEAEATIEMSLRLLGGTEESVAMATLESLESEDKSEKKRKLEGKLTRPSDDAMYLRREIIDANKRSNENIETCSKKVDEKMEIFDEKMESCLQKTDEKMNTFLQTISDSVGSQLQGTIGKMKEEGDDRCKQINDRIANMENKISDIDEKCENRTDKFNRSHEDQNQVKAVVTRFHSETSESEVGQLLNETRKEMAMSIENARIECVAKPITLAFISLKNDDERNKYVRSANMLRKELRGRKIKMTRSMDAEERLHLKKEWDMSNPVFT